jgi:hypothetical protein
MRFFNEQRPLVGDLGDKKPFEDIASRRRNSGLAIAMEFIIETDERFFSEIV